MNIKIQKFIAKKSANISADFSLQLANNIGQGAALKSANAWTLMSNYALLRIEGKDATDFLQGQFSNDVKALSNEAVAQYSTYSTVKGRMLASFLLWKQNEQYFLLLRRDLSAEFSKRLSMFVLRAQVKISQIDEESILIGAIGEAVEQALNSFVFCPTLTMQVCRNIDSNISAIRLGNEALLLIADAKASDELLDNLDRNSTLVSSEAWRYFDINAGIAWICLATKEAFVAQMANMDGIGAISFTKGCYVGQEVIARTRYLGKVKRHLYKVFSSERLNIADELCTEESDQVIGIVVDACAIDEQQYLALAVILDAAYELVVCTKNNTQQKLQLLHKFDQI